MEFKEIKPGMVIHCPSDEDSLMLMKHLRELGYKMLNYDDPVENIIVANEDYGGTVYFLDSREKGTITWSSLKRTESLVCDITEFSDLIVPESNTSNAQSNTQSDKTNAQMSAIEVLEWLEKYGDETEILYAVFDDLYCTSYDDIFGMFSPEEIVTKITAYEAAKQKPVEVEWVDICQIHDEDGTIMDEVDITDCPIHDTTEKIMKDYNIPNKTGYYATIERRCRVKEG